MTQGEFLKSTIFRREPALGLESTAVQWPTSSTTT
jgi:hypothetical protein